MGALADSEGDLEDELEGDDRDKGASEGNFYNVIGTMVDPKGVCPTWAKESVQVCYM